MFDWRTFLLGADGRLQWETLVTGGVALLAAWLAYVQLGRQIRLEHDRRDHDRRIQQRVATAFLPLALTGIGEYAGACIKQLYKLLCCWENGQLDADRAAKIATIQQPVLPNDIISILKDGISSFDEDTAKEISSIIRWYQINNSRISDRLINLKDVNGTRITVRHNIITDIILSAEIYARAETLFPFARGNKFEGSDITADDIRRVLIVGGNIPDPDELVAEWERTHPASTASGHISAPPARRRAP